MKFSNKGFQATKLGFTSLVTGLLFIVMLQLNACGGGSSTSELGNTTTPNSPNSPNSSNSSNSFSGVAQKGPFSAGSEVRVEQLTEQGKPTEHVIQTQTTGTAGNFNFTIPESWQPDYNRPIQITINGSYLDESYSSLNISDDSPLSSHQITLNALLDRPSNTSVNLLTHWVALRAKFLVFRENKHFSDALQQASSELQKYTGINHISELDFSQNETNNSDNLQLLLLSGALLEIAKNHDQPSQFVINEIAVDFAEDGVINHQGKVWFKRIQATIRLNPKNKTKQYAKVLSEHLGKTIDADALPDVVSIAARPQALVPQTITAETGQTVTLDGSSSLSANGATLQYTWIRLDQQTQFDVPISNRFIANPTITVPPQTADLLFALFVIDDRQIADTAIVRVKARPPQPANQSPVANSQFINTTEDTQKSIILSGSDADGDELTFNLAGRTPIILEHGTLEGNLPTLTYTPDDDFSGTDYFDFTVSDASSTSATARINITIDAVNDTPVVVGNQIITTNENTATTAILTGWSDVDNNLSDLTFNIVKQTDNGQLNTVSSSEIQYTPNDNFFGSDSFSYQVNDGQGGISNTTTVAINVLSVNDNPNAIPPSDTLTINQDTELAIALQGNDPDGDPITYELVTAPVNGGLFVNGNAVTSDNSVLAGSPPNLIYKPYSAFVGDDSFTFLVRDSKGLTSAIATVPIKVLFVNIQPQAEPKTVTTNSNTSVPITLTGSDGNDDALSFSNTSNPLHGNLSGIPPHLIYTPDTNYIGSDAFTYEASDGTDVSNSATVNITVNNQAPTANAGLDQTSTSGDEVTLNGADSADPEGQIRYIWTASDGITLSDNTVVNPTFTAPTVTSTTTYTFTLVVTDSRGLDSATDSVVVTVKPLPNQAPIADAGTDRTINSNTPVTLSGTGSDLEDDTTTIFSWTAPSIIPLSSYIVANPTFTTPTVSITTDFTFTLIVTDSQGLASTADSVVITVNPLPNQAPTANPGEDQTVRSGTEVTLDGTGSSDPEDGTISSFSWTSLSGITLSNTAIANPTFTAPIVTIPTDYTFKLVVADSQGRFSFDPTVVITVNPPNQVPVADAGIDQVITSGNKVTLNGNGTDQEGSVTYQWVSLDNIQLSNDTATQPFFTPAVTMTTIYRFKLVITDEDQATASDTVQITVTPTDRYKPGDSWDWEVIPASAYQALSLTTYDITGLVSVGADPASTVEMDNLFSNLTNPQGNTAIAAIHTLNINDNNPFGNNYYYASYITGEIVVPEDGLYQFSIDGDDAIDLFIDSNLIVGWYGTHANCDSPWNYACQATELTQTVSLTAGSHTITFRHEESLLHDNYRLFWKHSQ